MESERRKKISELIAVGSLALTIAAALYLVLGSDQRYDYTLRFETGGQLVPGNEVRVGGPAIGSVEDVSLADDYAAEVEISIDRRLPEGTRAVIRTTSQSGIANRYVSLVPGSEGGTYIPPGSTIDEASTTSPVDFDQLLAAFGPRTRDGLRQLIRGGATTFRGNAAAASRAFHYLFPALAENRELLAELARDREALDRLASEGATVFGVLAGRRDELSSLVGSAETALGAVAAEHTALARSLSRLPATIGQATRTLASLRAARADLDPLIAAGLDATPGLTSFLRRTTPVLERAVPVVSGLRSVAARSGPGNDLAELLAATPPALDAGSDATGPALDALGDSRHIVAFARPYAPDLLGWLTKFGQASAYFDGNGHYVRVTPANANIFSFNEGTGMLEPTYSDPSQVLDGMETGAGAPCPGSATQPSIDGSSPFTDHGRLGLPLCDPAFVPPGS
jgi:phospholipid/cholesterol/gamma-HCH transport system substrate-binding protein